MKFNIAIALLLAGNTLGFLYTSQRIKNLEAISPPLTNAESPSSDVLAELSAKLSVMNTALTTPTATDVSQSSQNHVDLLLSKVFVEATLKEHVKNILSQMESMEQNLTRTVSSVRSPELQSAGLLYENSAEPTPEQIRLFNDVSREIGTKAFEENYEPIEFLVSDRVSGLTKKQVDNLVEQIEEKIAKGQLNPVKMKSLGDQYNRNH